MSFYFQEKFNRDSVAPNHTGKGRSWSLKKMDLFNFHFLKRLEVVVGMEIRIC